MRSKQELSIFFGGKDIETKSYGKLKEINFYFAHKVVFLINRLNNRFKHYKIPYKIKIELANTEEYTDKELDFYKDVIDDDFEGKPSHKEEIKLFRLILDDEDLK